jgi:hypothetical protein
MDLALVGSATSSGIGLTWLYGSVFCLGFFGFLGLRKNRGPKQVGWMHEGWIMQEGGAVQAGCMQ